MLISKCRAGPWSDRTYRSSIKTADLLQLLCDNHIELMFEPLVQLENLMTLESSDERQTLTDICQTKDWPKMGTSAEYSQLLFPIRSKTWSPFNGNKAVLRSGCRAVDQSRYGSFKPTTEHVQTRCTVSYERDLFNFYDLLWINHIYYICMGRISNIWPRTYTACIPYIYSMYTVYCIYCIFTFCMGSTLRWKKGECLQYHPKIKNIYLSSYL